MRKVFDTFMFFNELDLLEIRLNILDPYIDFFVISESTQTFSGKSKILYYKENKARFAKFHHKIIHQVVDDTPDDFSDFTPKHNYYTNWNQSYPHKSNCIPLKKLSVDFQREVYQRDSVINPLLGLASDDDVIIMSDLDEIPHPNKLNYAFSNLNNESMIHFKQKWFMYYLNNYCEKDWFGSHICLMGYLKKHSVDLLQYHKEDSNMQSGGLVINDGGWHFSFLGGEEAVREKLDAYSYQGGRTARFLALWDKIFKGRIKRKIENNEDIFLTNRVFKKVFIDNSFPDYIINNIDIYDDLIKK